MWVWHDVDGFEGLDLSEVEAEGFERAFEFAGGAVGDLGPGLAAADVEVAVVGVLIAPAVDFDVDLLGELAAQVVDVDAGAAVDVRREFLGEERCAQRLSPVTGRVRIGLRGRRRQADALCTLLVGGYSLILMACLRERACIWISRASTRDVQMTRFGCLSKTSHDLVDAARDALDVEVQKREKQWVFSFMLLGNRGSLASTLKEDEEEGNVVAGSFAGS